jgi:NAD(P)-dependent dehydrogenase (short-subunit alcohol dehydrogenase family)
MPEIEAMLIMVRVNAISPGYFPSGMSVKEYSDALGEEHYKRQYGIPFGRPGTLLPLTLGPEPPAVNDNLRAGLVLITREGQDALGIVPGRARTAEWDAVLPLVMLLAQGVRILAQDPG